MPADRTEITEIVTGLATYGATDLPSALADPPVSFGGVGDERWQRLREMERAGRFRAEFAAAWANGRCLLDARDGLRGRPPVVVEWKGPQRPPGTEPIPADLRVDHVYLVSCKYNSRIQLNASPWSIFDAAAVADARGDCYGEVAAAEQQALYEIVRFETGLVGALPDRVDDRAAGEPPVVEGHIEVRWTHGRFGGLPEAKAYLDTPHHQVAGYWPLT